MEGRGRRTVSQISYCEDNEENDKNNGNIRRSSRAVQAVKYNENDDDKVREHMLLI